MHHPGLAIPAGRSGPRAFTHYQATSSVARARSVRPGTHAEDRYARLAPCCERLALRPGPSRQPLRHPTPLQRLGPENKNGPPSGDVDAGTLSYPIGRQVLIGHKIYGHKIYLHK